MPYATPLDLEQRFGAAELIQQTDLTGAANTDTLARVLDDASALIDGYLASRYPLPIATPTRRSPPGRTGFRMRAGWHGPSGSSTRCSSGNARAACARLRTDTPAGSSHLAIDSEETT